MFILHSSEESDRTNSSEETPSDRSTSFRVSSKKLKKAIAPVEFTSRIETALGTVSRKAV
ncbi:hypothetical protein [Nostoc sphaeroides]|uniref:hypothetical protein n=1 Tax=Nostoc sphaeroides TaxID=446679 RepID=UPI00126A47F2|nr:hypothetical protein [Nostoc sphaeroides]